MAYCRWRGLQTVARSTAPLAKRARSSITICAPAMRATSTIWLGTLITGEAHSHQGRAYVQRLRADRRPWTAIQSLAGLPKGLGPFSRYVPG